MNMAVMDRKNTILVIDDEERILSLMKRFLESENFRVETEFQAEKALEFMMKNQVDLVLVDLRLSGMPGDELVRAMKEMKYPAEVIVISGYGTVESAVETIKQGAYDFIEKPINLDRLLLTIKNALQKGNLENKIAFLESKIKNYMELDGVIGNSESFVETKKLAKQLANTDVNLLITGESGTGKEVFSRAIHNASKRGDGPLIAVNCGAIPDNLLESELFGHEKGAFSGAVARRIGHFENADGGTIFLDEVSELPISLQVKLLRMVQEKEIMRLGSSHPVKVDCRIISATNRDLETEVAEHRFREDLYYRLNVIELRIPPLRERLDDVPLLVNHFLKKYADNEMKVSKDVMDILQSHHWPGNVRELENIIQRAVALTTEKIISREVLPDKLLKRRQQKHFDMQFCSTDYKQAQQIVIDSFEREFLTKALRRHNGNISKCADEMGLVRQTLHKMLNKHDIDARAFKH